MRQAVFLDRDGVLNALVERDSKWLSPLRDAEFALLPGAAQAVQALRATGLLAIVITNQPELRRGRLSAVNLALMHAQLEHDLEINAIYFCPHDDADNCACRKPRPGLLRAAARDWDIDLDASFLVGDTWKDIAAGRAAGCRTIHVVDTNRTRPESLEARAEANREKADARVADLSDAVEWILGELARPRPRIASRSAGDIA
jgi:D-glycero-D-manno-heptose 1,7-bisphosphate phosphatase